MFLPFGLIGVDSTPIIYVGYTSLFYDFFIHSDAKINLGWLGKFIVSPQNHRVHHSSLKKHYDKNFGERITLWDWLFGTLSEDRFSYPPTGCPESSFLMESNSNFEWPFKTFLKHYFYPFLKIYQSLKLKLP